MENIVIEGEYTPISKDFKLENLKNFNIVIGKNNVGKTRLFEAIKNAYSHNVIYIQANKISADDLKETTDASILVKNLTEILQILELKQVIDKESINTIDKILLASNESFKNITNNDKQLGKINSSEEIYVKDEWLVRSILSSGEKASIKDEGQGHQRLAVALFLKECLECRKNSIKNKEKNDFILLFEEPEVFLHPELKRVLNKTLIEISKTMQVIISTHDPYFLWSHMNDEENVEIYTLERDNGGDTKISKNTGLGVEDEMLFISLFSKLLKELKELRFNINFGKKMDEFSMELENLGGEEFEKIKYKYENEDYYVILPIYIRNKIHHQDNQDNKEYTNENLKCAIKCINKLLLKI